MKKAYKILCILFVTVFLLGMTLEVSAASAPYETYTYDINNNIVKSPHAYTPGSLITNYEMNMEVPLNSPQDLFVDDNHWVYISDTKNKRVVVTDENFIYQYEITGFINEQGVHDSLSEPTGLFVFEDKLYVCDTINARIVVFDIENQQTEKKAHFTHIVEAPNADVMGSDLVFRPTAVAVNKSGTMYIVSKTTYSGIIALNADGSFQSFIGAQKATVSMAVRIRRIIFPNVVTESYLSTPYKNIAMDDEGIIWATIVFSDKDEEALANALQSKNTLNDTYAPVKRLNAKGDDIMVRNGFAIPGGDLNFTRLQSQKDMSKHIGPSELVDIAIGPNGMWTVVDAKRGKLFTYDSEGNMLFAFGDQGKQLGNLSTPTAISYCGSDLYVLDSTLNGITVFKRTDYGDVIDMALMHNNNRQYSEGYNDWKEILKRNINFDAAYVGIGKNLYRQGEYVEAMEYYEKAWETENYSVAFKAHRKEMTEKYILVVVLVIVAFFVLLGKFLGYVGKKNKAGVTKVGKRTLWEEFLYGFYVIGHPFDGFWDLKHEKRGSVRGATVILGITGLSILYNAIGSAYLFGKFDELNVWVIMSVLVGPFAIFGLWCVANWCLTTLFDGEGTLKDIYISSAYALMPIPLLMIPATILTHFCSLSEAEFVTLLIGIAYFWTGMLLFFGSMTTHGYSMGRNIVITFFTLLGMLFIMFVIVLFANLITRMVSFVSDIITELSYRAQ